MDEKRDYLYYHSSLCYEGTRVPLLKKEREVGRLMVYLVLYLATPTPISRARPPVGTAWGQGCGTKHP